MTRIDASLFQSPQESFQAILDALNERIVGQERAKQFLAVRAAEHQHRVVRAEGDPRVLLLVGSPGSGKTELCRALARILEVPFYRVDAHTLTTTSFAGVQVGEIAARLLAEASVIVGEGATKEEVHDLAERGVVMVDEIDKIAYITSVETEQSSYERHREGVQAALLPLFEGKVLIGDAHSGREDFNSEGLLVLAAGSFADRKMIRIVNERRVERSTQEHYKHISFEDLKLFGFLPEIIGRISKILALDKLDDAQLADIFRKRHSMGSMRVMNKTISMSDEVSELLGRRARSFNLGARAIGQIIEVIRVDVYLKEETLLITDDEIVVTADYVHLRWPD